MKQLTRELIDVTHQYNGTFFLPYQLHYTEEQLQKSYPQIEAFLAAKKKYEPCRRFLEPVGVLSVL